MEAEKISHEVLLSARELEIVELVVTGLSNHKVAQILEISKRTVDNHISNILKKTGVTNRVELVRWSLQWGKVCLDEVNCCSIADLTQSLKPDEVVS